MQVLRMRLGATVGKWLCLVGLGLVPAGQIAAQNAPQEVADALIEATTIPAATAGRVTADTLEWAVAGQRMMEADALAQMGDAWHIGSLTKSMTATLAARLVEAGVITWDTSVGAVLGTAYPDMHADLQETPLRALLTHTAGMEANLPTASARRLAAGQRRLYVEEMLFDPPATPVGEFAYSNAGYVVAGAMLEAVARAPWEDLMQTHLFRPLGIRSAGFGPPQGDAIEGHALRFFGGIRPAGQGEDADNIAAMGPAGRVHLSAEDMLIYLRAHLLRDEAFLAADTWEALHAPVGEQAYAMGWGVGEDGSLVHSGSNTLWYAVAYLDPAAGEAVFVAVNSGDLEAAAEPVDVALRALLRGL